MLIILINDYYIYISLSLSIYLSLSLSIYIYIYIQVAGAGTARPGQSPQGGAPPAEKTKRGAEEWQRPERSRTEHSEAHTRTPGMLHECNSLYVFLHVCIKGLTSSPLTWNILKQGFHNRLLSQAFLHSAHKTVITCLVLCTPE